MRLVDADKLYDDFIDDLDDWLKDKDYDIYCCVGDAIREVMDQQKIYNSVSFWQKTREGNKWQ